jgi:glycosyltransferase involved in cell wall biosynthesis
MRAMVELNDLDIRLTYVGDGPGKKELMELCNELGVTDKVKILGRVSLEELLSILRTVHVCVVPSMWEGFGLAAAEAIKAGVPVLASDSGGLREIIRDGYNGFLIPINSDHLWSHYIRRLYQDRALLAQLSQNCKKTAEQFDWSITGLGTINAILWSLSRRRS